ncbi:MAG: hypothetical protein LBG87_07910 [Spirochaetaceae bacterium]|jgi:hypothetical protein|nr:hypothetical protein [Spirochaetaceae bacterium]
METIIGAVAAVALLSGILWFVKRFVKPVKGNLPDCCGLRGNRDIKG